MSSNFPNRIECIAVDKVYDSCFQTNDITRNITIGTGTGEPWEGADLEVGDIMQCGLDTSLPEEGITCSVISRIPVGEGFYTLNILVTVPVVLTNEDDEVFETTFNFTKTVTLCAPEGVNIDCSESVILACNCVVTAVDIENETVTVTCDIQICFVIKSILTVQLLVPSYGFCVPAPCVTLPGVCPPLPPEQCF